MMTLQIEPRHDLSPNDIGAIEDHLYGYNSHATGRHDGQGLGFVIRDEAGRMIGAAAGYTWAGTSELKQMWVDIMAAPPCRRDAMQHQLQPHQPIVYHPLLISRQTAL
jgi:hypothetical protein